MHFAIINFIYIYIGILYIKCPEHVLDITKFMSMDGTVLDIPSMDIVPSYYQHWPKIPRQIPIICRHKPKMKGEVGEMGEGEEESRE